MTTIQKEDLKPGQIYRTVTGVIVFVSSTQDSAGRFDRLVPLTRGPLPPRDKDKTPIGVGGGYDFGSAVGESGGRLSELVAESIADLVSKDELAECKAKLNAIKTLVS